jgi:immune inhibitor A
MYRSNFLAALVVLAGVLVAQRAEALHRQDMASRQEGARVTGLAAPLSSAVEMPAGQTVSLTQTASLLAGTDAPGRDLITLTQRLRLKSNEPIPSVVNTTPPNYTVGTRHVFNIADITRNNYFTATASIRVVTEHAYWYVKDGYNVGNSALQKAAQHFEEHIYPETRRVFGQEINPGVDNDTRITVLIAPVPGVGGYFSSADAYPRIVNPNSNQRDMIYISSVPRGDPLDPDNYFMGTLAHEFQHMIHWNVHRDREVWVDEGCAEIAMYLNGYDPGGSDMSFTLTPDTQLNAWDDTSKAIQHYGASYMFLRYGMDRFGGEGFLGKLLASNRLGVAGFDEALAASGYTEGFDGAFKDWTVANMLNDSKLDGGRYSYSQGGRVAPGRTISGYPATRSESVHQYAADYIRLTGRTRGATITFKGDSTVRVIAAEPHGGSAFWYSNRRDSGDATLTREFDLSRASKATLKFWTWFNIESMFDYGYVEASTDGGATWTPLKGKYTTTKNPNGTSYGHGWTGVSGAATIGNGSGTPKWVEESVDLSAYAGKRVLVRLEYITDEGYNRPGMAIDDMRIPEINWSDDAESSRDWQAAGWIRIGNRVPEKWFVALIEKGNGGVNRVREMAVSSNGTGTLDIAGIGSGTNTREAVLVIAPLAPKTTEVANYTVTIKNR